MVPDFVRRSAVLSATFFTTYLLTAAGCGGADPTPFFAQTQAQGGASGSAQGGTSAAGSGGSTQGGTSAAGDGGNAGLAGSAGSAGSGAVAGTSSAGAGGAPTGGTSGAEGGGSSATSGSGGSSGTGGVTADCSSADPAALSFENHCYAYRATPRTWTAARDDCSSSGAHLVIFESDGRTEGEFEAENDFVWMLGGQSEVWMGATDGRQSNQSGDGTPYAWISGEAIRFDRWSPAQPDNSPSPCMPDAPCSCGESCWEHCAFMWDPGDDDPGTWNDRHCEHLIGYVCEWDAPP